MQISAASAPNQSAISTISAQLLWSNSSQRSDSPLSDQAPNLIAEPSEGAEERRERGRVNHRGCVSVPGTSGRVTAQPAKHQNVGRFFCSRVPLQFRIWLKSHAESKSRNKVLKREPRPDDRASRGLTRRWKLPRRQEVAPGAGFSHHMWV